ncbi:uncharacterized protein BJ171DRAFT_422965, partial [Polychytrium aggregatum]|uniref:uncharacterized protein n=1 Tax=Polychytrium aggregatum TaxID=110093 RepID=UPI0022FDCEF2
LLSGEEAVAHVAYGLSDLSFVYKVAPEGYLGQPLESLAKDSTPNAFHKSHKNLALSTREGAATAVHGALAAGAAVTTVTSSEALPLMIPAMYGIAAERKAVVFHVGSQAITSDLGVVSDYSDVLAASYTGFAFIGSSSVQEAHDLSLVAHLASSVAHQPVLHFFDGARVAKETAKTFVAPYHELSSLTRAIAHRHAAVPPVERFPEVVQEVMHELAKFFGHEYKLFEYVGAHDAESVIVTLGPASNVVETAVEHARQHGSKVGVLKIRLLRPWSAEHFVAAIPKTAKRIVVVEQATAAGTHGPLYLDVTGSFYSGHWTSAIPAISKAHFQAGVEHFHPAAVSAFLAKLSSSRRAPRIIELSAADVQKSAVADGVHQAVFWDAQEQGTAKVAQAVAQYIASESFGTVQSHTARDDVQIEPLSSTSLRYSKTHTAVNSHRVQAADYVAIHDVAAVERYNPIVAAKTGATVVINSAAATAAELEKELSDSVRAEIARKQLKVHVVDAQKYAKKFTLYLGKSTEYVNLILAAVFYKLAPAVDTQHALEHIFAIVRKTETHASIVQTKIAAVHQALDSITHIHVPAHWASATLDATLLTSVQGSLALPKTSAPSEEREQITRVVPSHRAAWSLLFREAYKTDKKLRPDVDNAFLVKVTENRRLTPVEYDRNVFHIEMDTTGTGLRYEIGEALGVHGHNSDEDVKTFIKFYGLDPREIVVTERVDESGKPSTEVRTVEQILTQVLDIFGKPGKKFYSSLAEFATDIKEREHLNTIASADGADELKRLTEEETVTFADILERFPSAHPSIEDLVKLVPAIKPRHYSISSSQNMHPDSVHLLVVLVDWRSSTGKTRVGQCTRYLNSLKVGQALTVTIKPSVMKLPKSLTAPVIMSGLGTGMAPFRAFIEERFYWKSQGMEVGPMVLYFGSRNRANEYLYGEELEAYHADGVLSRLQLAFSRDQKKKIYIQHKIAEDADLLAKYILKDEGAFYLCGPTWPVPDVKDALVGAFTAAGTTVERANELLEELKEQDRYILEVY